jgi:hypothetical protein
MDTKHLGGYHLKTLIDAENPDRFATLLYDGEMCKHVCTGQVTDFGILFDARQFELHYERFGYMLSDNKLCSMEQIYETDQILFHTFFLDLPEQDENANSILLEGECVEDIKVLCYTWTRNECYFVTIDPYSYANHSMVYRLDIDKRTVRDTRVRCADHVFDINADENGFVSLFTKYENEYVIHRFATK